MPFGSVLKELKKASSKDNPNTGSKSSVSVPTSNNQSLASTTNTSSATTDENQVKTSVSLSEALRSAASAGDFDRVKELCKNNVAIDCDGDGRTALHYASLNGHVQIVRELVASGAKVNVKDSSGFSPLHLAASEGHVEIVNHLLKSGSLIDAQDELQGNTALHEAAWKGFSQTIEVLMKNKANAYIKNKGGFSALHLCCQQGHNASARVLLISRCKPDLKNNYGDTPLHTAARYGHAGVARILISAFCEVSPVNKNGDTPLHITAAMGRRKLTKILLESGCNPTLINMQGETAMDIALRKSLKEVQEIIANPPPARDLRSSSKTKMTAATGGKKREKESSLESSKGSTGGGHKSRKELQKKSKLVSSRSVQFLSQEEQQQQQQQAGQQSSSLDRNNHHHHHHHQRRKVKEDNKVLLGHDSPYGCPESPDLSEFPGLKIDSLPKDLPLKKKGEQYYIDLAGNIRAGPVNRITSCNCKPLLGKVQRKMETDKQEIKDHIDCRHDHLKEKICHLEKKTTDMSETFKEKIACERAECMQRSLRSALRDKIEFERKQLIQVEQLKGHMKSWLDSKGNLPSSSGVSPATNTTASSSPNSVGRLQLPPLQLLSRQHDYHSSSSPLNLDVLRPKLLPHPHHLLYPRNQTTSQQQQSSLVQQQETQNLSSNYAVLMPSTLRSVSDNNYTNRSYSTPCTTSSDHYYQNTNSLPETRQLLGNNSPARLSAVPAIVHEDLDSDGHQSPSLHNHARITEGYSSSVSSLSPRFNA